MWSGGALGWQGLDRGGGKGRGEGSRGCGAFRGAGEVSPARVGWTSSVASGVTGPGGAGSARAGGLRRPWQAPGPGVGPLPGWGGRCAQARVPGRVPAVLLVSLLSRGSSPALAP